jgi:hypothetical protein
MTSNYDYDLFKMIGIVIFVGIVLYIIVRALSLHLDIQNNILEGMTNAGDNENVGSGAASFSTKVTTLIAQVKDKLNVDKYRSDYENCIIHLDEYISGMMLLDILSLNPNSLPDEQVIKVMERINTLKNGKDSLNVLMKSLDSM